jgi:signal transduction histidine kinase
MVLFGFTWLLRLIGAIAQPVTSAIGTLIGPAYLGVLIHLLVTFPSGRIATAAQRWVVGAGYLLTVPMAGLVLVLGDVDPAVSAPPGLLLGLNIAATAVDPGPAEKVGTLAVVAALIAAAVLVTLRWSDAGPAERRSTAPTVFSGVAIALTIALDHLGALDPSPDFAGTLLAWTARVILLVWPAALLWGVLRSRLDQSAVSDLILEFGSGMPMPERLQKVVAGTLHDPTARIAYWLPARQNFVDSQGGVVVLDPVRKGRAVAYLERDGERVAALEHDAMLAGEGQLVNGVIAGIGLAVENERLRVEVRAQLREVMASRARIVDAADAARRRVESDLHDGAYRRLESVATALDDYRSTLGSAPAEDLLTDLDEISRDLATALDELRTLARGIYPVLLADAGLGPAVSALVDRSTIPAEIVRMPAERYPAPVERAGYFVILEALDNASKRANSHRIIVDISCRDGCLRIEVVDDGVADDNPNGSGSSGLADRVAALGGTLTMQSEPGAGTRIRAELPLGVAATGPTLVDVPGFHAR